MKKLIVMAGLVAALVMTGCGGEAPTPSLKDPGVEEIKVEQIQVEEIRVEEIRVETIDDEFAEELRYNSQVNTWENAKIEYWD